jgi:beta-glucosidase
MRETPMTATRLLALPPDFTWGVSTSSYQIEGAAAEDGRGPSIWDRYCREKGRVANGDTGDVACDHYHRFAEDIALMQRLGIKAYRFSVSWPRVLPNGRGRINPLGLDFYSHLTDALLAAQIEPWLCLYHWDLPLALDNEGGWLNRDSAGWFADYAALIGTKLGDRIKHFATFNEPNVSTLFGYGMGWNAPGISDAKRFYTASHHVNLAHGAAVEALRGTVREASIGAIYNRQPCLPVSTKPEDAIAAQKLDACWNRFYADPQILAEYPPELIDETMPSIRPGDIAQIAQPMDWFGLNHYSPIYARHADNDLGFAWADPPADGPVTGVGWRIHPEAFREEILETCARYRLPVYITENGSGGSDAMDEAGNVNDPGRISYLDDYTRAMAEALQRGADVRGYFVWSLLDNFEWGSGYGNRFGLVYVDYPTQKRIPKSSFDWYAQLIAVNR